MLNLAPSRALVRRAYQLTQLGFAVAAVGIFLLVLAALGFVIPPFPPTHSAFPLLHLARVAGLVAGAGVLLGGAALVIRAWTQRRDNDLALMTGSYLSQHLDDSFVFIRNVNRPGLGYIDAVLIGPPGALVFRILDHEGSLANEASHWMKQTSSGEWTPLGFSPTRDAVVDVQHLRRYLARRRLGDVPVFGVVVFVKDESVVPVALKEPVVPVAHLSTLVETLQNDYLAQRDRVTPAQVTAVRRLLLEEA